MRHPQPAHVKGSESLVFPAGPGRVGSHAKAIPGFDGWADRPAWLLPPDRWPADVPPGWSAWVDRAESAGELDAPRASVRRGRPYGSDRWRSRTARRLGLEATLRPPARPRVRPIKDSRPL
jgi:hypothetical protein